MIRRTPLRQASKRRKGEAVSRAKVRHAVLSRDGFRCRAESLVPAVACSGRLEVHEVIPRSAWPGVHLLADHAIAICSAHHRWVGDYPHDAHAAGLHGFSWERPT